jgi:RNA polymerase sigma factor (sigma-70 family)
MHQHAAYRAACFVAGPDDAEEVTQLAFIKAYYALGRFDADRPFRPWLLRIALNEARTARRSARRHALRAAAVYESRAGDDVDAPEARAAELETRSELATALGRLPAEHRDVVACRYLLELSENETARVLDVRAGTVKSRLSRALGRLRRELEPAPSASIPAGDE